MFADAKEAANTDHHGFDVAALVGQKIVDYPIFSLLSLYTFNPTSSDVRQLPFSDEVSKEPQVRRWWRCSVFAIEGGFARTQHSPAARTPRRRQRHI